MACRGAARQGGDRHILTSANLEYPLELQPTGAARLPSALIRNDALLLSDDVDVAVGNVDNLFDGFSGQRSGNISVFKSSFLCRCGIAADGQHKACLGLAENLNKNFDFIHFEQSFIKFGPFFVGKSVVVSEL